MNFSEEASDLICNHSGVFRQLTYLGKGKMYILCDLSERPCWFTAKSKNVFFYSLHGFCGRGMINETSRVVVW